MAARRQLNPDDPGAAGPLGPRMPAMPPMAPGAPTQELNLPGGQLPQENAPGVGNPGGYQEPGSEQTGPGGPIETGQSKETPRERQAGQATPRMPMSPTPAPSNTAQLIPFNPVSSTPANQMVLGRSNPFGSLFGASGGLKGGGLGVPDSGSAMAPNQDLSGLLKMLMMIKGM